MAITPYSRPAEVKFMPLPYESMIQEAQKEYYMDMDAQRQLAAQTGKALGQYTSLDVLPGDQQRYDDKKTEINQKFEDYYSNYGQNARDPKSTMEFFKLASQIENDPELRMFKYNKNLVDKNRESILSNKNILPLSRTIELNKLSSASSFDEDGNLRYLTTQTGIDKFDESKLINELAKSADMTAISEEYKQILGPDGKVSKTALMRNKSNLPALSNLQNMVLTNSNVQEKYNYLARELGNEAAESYINDQLGNAIEQAQKYFIKTDQTKIGEGTLPKGKKGTGTAYAAENMLYTDGALNITNLLENTGYNIDDINSQKERDDIINNLDREIEKLESDASTITNPIDKYKINDQINQKKANLNHVRDINETMKNEFALAKEGKSGFSNADGTSFGYKTAGRKYTQAKAALNRLKKSNEDDPLFSNRVDLMEETWYPNFMEYQKTRKYVKENKKGWETTLQAVRRLEGEGLISSDHLRYNYGNLPDYSFSNWFAERYPDLAKDGKTLDIAKAVEEHRSAESALGSEVVDRVLAKVEKAEQSIQEVKWLKAEDLKPFKVAYAEPNNAILEHAKMDEESRDLIASGKELTLKNVSLNKTPDAGGVQMVNLEYSVKGSDNTVKLRAPVLAALKDRVGQINMVTAERELNSLVSNNPKLQETLEKTGGREITPVDVLAANNIITQISPQLIPELAGNVKFNYQAGGDKIDKHYKITPSRTKDGYYQYKVSEVNKKGEIIPKPGSFASIESVKNAIMLMAVKHNRVATQKKLNEKKKLNSIATGPLSINSLLNTIKKESGAMSENAVAGSTAPDPSVSTNTIGQNKAKYGNKALGEFQIQYKTAVTAFNALKNAGLLTAKEISDGVDNFKYTKENQKKLAKGLLLHRGFNDYQKGIIDSNEFKFNLSQEWAMFPAPKGSKLSSGEIADGETSYWKGVGKNKALISSEEFDKLFNS